MTTGVSQVTTPPIGKERFARALCSLEGLSLGDAFGECFLAPPDTVARRLEERIVPAPRMPYTDDTQMALSVVATLRRYGGIDQEYLAHSFAEHYEPWRDY